MLIDIPYNRSQMILRVDSENLLGVLTSNLNHYQPQLPQEHIVQTALRNPISSLPLANLSENKEKVVIITSDHTRGVPSRITLPLIIEEIKRGNPAASITILIATGLHRATTQTEMVDMFGQKIVDDCKIVVHDAFNPEELVYIGLLPSGSRLSVNRLAVEADFLVCEGFIEPHFFAGFSGGRKSILPGISSAEAINCNHSARAIAHKDAKTGSLSGNPIHEDMAFAAMSVGVDFILNVALNANKEIIAAFAGDISDAHLKGCQFVEQLSAVPRVEADIVVTSNGGYPLDQDLYQCAKGISTAAESLKPGGIIIMVASCIAGIGGGEGFERLMTCGDPESILEIINQTGDTETVPGQWCAQILAKILLQYEVILVTDNLDPKAVSSMNMIPASSLDDALEIAQEKMGDKASILVIPDGVAVVVQRVHERGVHNAR